jgi:prepilin-type N-terminal cleavage/methylation domain-containing protein
MKKIYQRGFTIVELVVVVAVIGILATITVTSYRGVQESGYDASVQADFASITDMFQIFKLNNGQYPTTTLGVTSLSLKVAQGAYAVSPKTPTNLTACYSDDGSEIALVALSKSGKAYYMYSVQGTSTKPLPGSWESDAKLRCKAISPNLSNTDPVTGNDRNYNGYNVSDTTTGPWRAWVGGN